MTEPMIAKSWSFPLSFHWDDFANPHAWNSKSDPELIV